MPTVNLHIETQDQSEDVPLVLSDDDLLVLRRYHRNVERLKKPAFVSPNLPTITNFSFDASSGPRFQFTDFELPHVHELLHVARPIFLSSEPASFERAMSVFGRHARRNLLGRYLRQIGDLYKDGEYKPFFQISVNDQPLFTDKALRTWLNGVEYHQDEDKAEIIDQLASALSQETTQAIFISQLSGRVKTCIVLDNELVRMALEAVD